MKGQPVLIARVMYDLRSSSGKVICDDLVAQNIFEMGYTDSKNDSNPTCG